MIVLRNNKGNEVKIFAKTFEQGAYDQIKALANYSAYEDAKIRIMPDAHAGAGCTIGTTIELNRRKVTPNLVGVDIGCGMICVPLDIDRELTESDFREMENVINTYIPSGCEIHTTPAGQFPALSRLRCAKHVDLERASKSLGSLGGGNHFIEIDRSEKGQYYLVIHSGSRHLGVQVCKYYQDLAEKKLMCDNGAKDALIKKLKAEGRQKEIQKELAKLHKPVIIKELAHLEDRDFDDYINDMEITQDYAAENRRVMCRLLEKHVSWMKFGPGAFSTVHNYIDINSLILRKGAVSAGYGEKLIIPMNMRDGSLICIGKGNPDWNYSAPHGAGRLMSRSKAKETIDMDDYKESMEGITTWSVNQSTIDESPMAYKPMDEIIECIEPAVEIQEIIKPVYNFKAGE